MEVGLIGTRLVRLVEVPIRVIGHIEWRAIISIAELIRLTPASRRKRTVHRLAAHDEGAVADAGGEGPWRGLREARWMMIAVYRLAVENEWRRGKAIGQKWRRAEGWMVGVWHPMDHVGRTLVSATMMAVLVSTLRVDILLMVL